MEICQICGEFLSTKSALTRHIQSIHNKSTFRCDLCHKYFTRQDALKLHIKTQHKKSNIPSVNKPTHVKVTPTKRFKCDHCGKKYTEEIYLRRHRLRHFSKNYKYRCCECNKRFISPSERNRHIYLRHYSDIPKDYSCHECQKKFKTKDTLTAHEKIHLKSRTCILCNKICPNIFRHCRKKHLKDAFEQCKVCGAMFFCKKELSGHANLHNQKQSTRHRNQ